jgi:hypothetical protein
MSLGRFLVCGLVFAVVSSAANAQITQAKGKYTFRMKFAAGQFARYVSEFKQAGAGGMVVALPFSQKVRFVRNGVANLDVAMGPAKMNGRVMGQEPNMVSMQLNASGKQVSGSAPTPGISVFPTTPIRIGDKWSGDMSLASSGLGANEAKAVYTFEKVGTYAGKKVAVIGFKLNSGGTSAINGVGRNYVQLSDGWLVGAEMNLSMNLTTDSKSNPTALKFKMTVKRL